MAPTRKPTPKVAKKAPAKKPVTKAAQVAPTPAPPTKSTITVEIKSRWTGAVFYSAEVERDAENPLREVVVKAVVARANLAGAYLAGAYLAGAYLTDAYLAKAYATRCIVPEGNLIGWKKLTCGVICKLLIPTDALRVGGLTGRKCRASFARVLEGPGISSRNGIYEVGKLVYPDKYDPDPRIECSNGIHFFITRQEAEDYNP